MTIEEARNIYDIPWGQYLVATVMAGQLLRLDNNREAYQAAFQCAGAQWQALADATGHPVPEDMKRPRPARPVASKG